MVRVEVATTTAFPLDMDGGRNEDGYTYAQLSSVQNLYEQQLWPPVYETEIGHHVHHMAAEHNVEPIFGDQEHEPNDHMVMSQDSANNTANSDDVDSDGVPRVRQAANVRERKRMCSINKAFEVSLISFPCQTTSIKIYRN